MSSKRKRKLSVVIITHNEEKLLPNCLLSVIWADEIIVLDTESSDGTCDIAKKFGAKVYRQSQWFGFGKQRQLAQQYARGDYILMLDADERVSKELKKSIIFILYNLKPGNIVYSCIRHNLFFGKFLNYCGWSKNEIVRFYPNKKFFYNSMTVHESLNFYGAKICLLHGVIFHITCCYLPKFSKKQCKYAEMWALENFINKKRCNFFDIILHTCGAFFKIWLLKAGCLNGKYGWLIAVIQAQYTFNKYAFLWSFYIKKIDKHYGN